MDIELQQYNKNNSALELNIADLKLKVKAAEKEVEAEKERVKAFLAVVRRFKVDINDCVQHIQDPKVMKSQVKKMYQKYCNDTTHSKETLEVDAQHEYARQRDYLERTVDSLRYKLHKDQEAHRSDNVKIMTENVGLIKEINQLRRNIVMARAKERVLETDYKLSKLDAATAPAAEEKTRQPKLPQIIDASIVSP
jgi:chromosome segregation ATPase